MKQSIGRIEQFEPFQTCRSSRLVRQHFVDHTLSRNIVSLHHNEKHQTEC